MVGRYFSKEEEKEIVTAIRAAERLTSGQIHVHIKRKCEKEMLSESHRLFKRLGLHKTPQKNAVLIFVAPESRKVAIVGDEGIHEKAGGHFWDSARDLMIEFFKKNEIKKGILSGIHHVGKKLEEHFPVKLGDTNLLSDTITED